MIPSRLFPAFVRVETIFDPIKYVLKPPYLRQARRKIVFCAIRLSV